VSVLVFSSKSRRSIPQQTTAAGSDWVDEPISALGQKQTWRQLRAMSALPPKADIVESDFGMSALGHQQTFSALFDYLIGARAGSPAT
jgi:hypothetical protein